MTEHNHRRGTRGSRNRRQSGCPWTGRLHPGAGKEWQRVYWGEYRALERKLIHHGRAEDIPLRHLHSIAWEYW